MRVKFKSNACGFGFGYSEGAEAELTQKDAERAIELGCAIPVRESEIETADSKAKPEKAVSTKRSRH